MGDRKQSIEISWWRLLFGLSVLTVLPAGILFGFSGRFDWMEAWIFVGVTTGLTLGSRVLVFRKSPELIAERAKFSDQENIKQWDKTLTGLAAIFGLLMFMAIGLDKRMGWSPELPIELQALALACTILGYFVGAWAMVENSFFSALVRIQRDRNHEVVTSGPYHYIRHPGYAGAIAANLATPFLLGSFWALAPAMVGNCLLIMRTAIEDRTLMHELDGYVEYMKQVRFRILPGVW